MEVNFNKDGSGLIPAIIQDVMTRKVLMLGYMNKEALDKTLKTNKVTFFSRSKNRLWTKGEESGHELHVKNIKIDCDGDALLVKVTPLGFVCHKGTDTCWAENNTARGIDFLEQLEVVIAQRKSTTDLENDSYVKTLFKKGINKIAQKVGEEAIEVVIESKDDNDNLFLNESADLLFHYLILLQAKGYKISDVSRILKDRHERRS